MTGEVKNGAPPPGVVYRPSATLVNGNTRTDQGDAFNAFRGYVGPQGGTFGNATAPPPKAADPALTEYQNRFTALAKAAGPGGNLWNREHQKELVDLEAFRKANPQIDQGFNADSAVSQDMADARSNMSAGGAAGSDPLLDLKSRRGALAGGYDPFAQFTPEVEARQDAANRAAGLVTPERPAVDADPLGRFDDPKNPLHGVITPAREAELATAAASPLTTPTPQAPMSAPVPPSANPFDPFTSSPPPSTSAPPRTLLPPGADPLQTPGWETPLKPIGEAGPDGTVTPLGSGAAPPLAAAGPAAAARSRGGLATGAAGGLGRYRGISPALGLGRFRPIKPRLPDAADEASAGPTPMQANGVGLGQSLGY